jgi:hypothetical protein
MSVGARLFIDIDRLMPGRPFILSVIRCQGALLARQSRSEAVTDSPCTSAHQLQMHGSQKKSTAPSQLPLRLLLPLPTPTPPLCTGAHSLLTIAVVGRVRAAIINLPVAEQLHPTSQVPHQRSDRNAASNDAAPSDASPVCLSLTGCPHNPGALPQLVCDAPHSSMAAGTEKKRKGKEWVG